MPLMGVLHASGFASGSASTSAAGRRRLPVASSQVSPRSALRHTPPRNSSPSPLRCGCAVNVAAMTTLPLTGSSTASRSTSSRCGSACPAAPLFSVHVPPPSRLTKKPRSVAASSVEPTFHAFGAMTIFRSMAPDGIASASSVQVAPPSVERATPHGIRRPRRVLSLSGRPVPTQTSAGLSGCTATVEKGKECLNLPWNGPCARARVSRGVQESPLSVVLKAPFSLVTA